MLLECLSQFLNRGQHQELEHLSVLVLLEVRFPPFSPPAGVSDLLCRHRDCVVSTHDVIGHTEHWKVHLIGPLIQCGVKLCSTDSIVCFIKAVTPSG